MSDAAPQAGPVPLEQVVGALSALRESGDAYAVLDVREGWELDICRLAEAVHIPLNELPARLSEVPGDRPLLVMCHHGQRSMMATRFLRANGFSEASNLAGGIDAVARQLDPALQTY